MRTASPIHGTVLLLLACSGLAACAGASDRRNGAEHSSNALPPRLDLHCTPQHDGDEAACRARGEGYSFRPPLVCRGVDVGPEVRDQERRVYEAGTAPCECVSAQREQECMLMP